MIVVGLTGGIASGKSTVAHFFKDCGATVLSADAIVRRLYGRKGLFARRIGSLFGREVLTRAAGSVNRRRLASLVFSDPKLRRRLEKLTHPAVMKEMERSLKALKERGENVVVCEVPLLFEVGLEKRFDTVVVVTAPATVQIARLMRRAHLARREARQRVKSQSPLSKKIKAADVVIKGYGPLGETRAAVISLWTDLLRGVGA